MKMSMKKDVNQVEKTRSGEGIEIEEKNQDHQYIKEDVDDLVEGEDLSEDFKDKADLQSSKQQLSPRHAMKSPVCIRQPSKSLMKNLRKTKGHD